MQSPVASPRPKTIDEAVDAARAALLGGRAADAERLAGYVLKSNRGHVAAARLLGQALLTQGRAREAVEPLQRAARRSQDPEIETLLARALAECGRIEDAFAQLRQATTRRPIFAPAFLELGDRLGRAGRYDEGAAVFEQGLALAPDAAVLHVGLAYICLHRNDRGRARALFGEVHAAHPSRHDAALGLAHVAIADGDYAEAARLYRRALELRPEDAAARMGLARCQLELGDRAAGEAALRAATRGGVQLAWDALTALCAARSGRAFLRPSGAVRFLSGASRPEAPPIDASVAADLA